MTDIQNNHSNSNLPLLDIKAVSHDFDYPLFKDINLSLQKGETIAIIGMSGSGKSTLLNIFSTLLTPNKGEVYYNNNNLLNISKKELLQIRRNDFGIIFQAHYLFRGFSAEENLMISELLSNNTIDEHLLDSLDISHVMKQGIGELSGGQQQRLSCARVLVKKPKIIFADEPTGNLDTQTAHNLINVLFDYVKENKAGLIMVTHEKEIANMCDKVYKLNEYRLEQIK